MHILPLPLRSHELFSYISNCFDLSSYFLLPSCFCKLDLCFAILLNPSNQDLWDEMRGRLHGVGEKLEVS